MTRLTESPYPQCDRSHITTLRIAAVAFLGWVLMERTYIGRQIYAVGGNREAARLAGIPINAG